MKKVEINLDFNSDQSITFGESTQLIVTKSRHYDILINQLNVIL